MRVPDTLDTAVPSTLELESYLPPKQGQNLRKLKELAEVQGLLNATSLATVVGRQDTSLGTAARETNHSRQTRDLLCAELNAGG